MSKHILVSETEFLSHEPDFFFANPVTFLVERDYIGEYEIPEQKKG
jgi:hypothetical protein